MNIQETLKELLETRREALIQNYSKTIHHNRKRMQGWAEAAEAFIRERLTIDENDQYIRFSTGYTRILERSANKDAIDQAIFKAVTSFSGLQDVKKAGCEGLDDVPTDYFGGHGRQIFGHIRRGTTQADKIKGATIYEDKYIPRWATDEEIQKFAEQMADDALADFVDKMTKKMAAIGEVKNATINYSWGDLFQTCLNVEFKNGIRFNMINSIVYKTSSRGLPFHQFPARFNSVTLNGVAQKGCASEAAVKRLAKSLN